MEITVHNPHKGRCETIDVEFTADNTTWFNLDSSEFSPICEVWFAKHLKSLILAILCPILWCQ